MIKKLLLLPVFIFITVVCGAQAFTLLGNPSSHDIMTSATNDVFGNFYFSGNNSRGTIISKLDGTNKEVWSKVIYDHKSPVMDYKTAFIDIIGDTLFGCGHIDSSSNVRGAFFFKMSIDSGHLYWFKREIVGHLELVSMSYSNDRFYIGGNLRDSSGSDMKVLSIKSSNGAIAWQSSAFGLEFPSFNIDSRDEMKAMTEVSNGQFFMTGSSRINGNLKLGDSRPFVIGMDINGNIGLKKYLGKIDSSPDTFFFEGVNIAFDGPNHLVLAYAGASNYGGQCSNYTTRLSKITTTGAEVFTKEFDFTAYSSELVKSLVVVNSNYYLFGETGFSIGGENLFCLKVNSNGLLMDSKIISKGTAALRMNSGNFKTGGKASFFNNQFYLPASANFRIPNDFDFLVVRLDQNMIPSPDLCVTVAQTSVQSISHPPFIGDLQNTLKPHSITLIKKVTINDHIFKTTKCSKEDILISSTEYGCDSTKLSIGSKTGTKYQIQWFNSPDTSSTFTVDTTFMLTFYNPIKCCEFQLEHSVGLNQASPKIIFPTDTLICISNSQDTVTLTPKITDCVGCLYEWNTGDTIKSIRINSSGLYTLKATNNCGKFFSKSINARFKRFVQIEAINDTMLCLSDYPLELTAISQNTESIYWSNGTFGDNVSFQNTGNQYLIGTNECGSVEEKFVFGEYKIPVLTAIDNIDTCILFNQQIEIPISSQFQTELYVNEVFNLNQTIQSSIDSNFFVSAVNRCGRDSMIFNIQIHHFIKYDQVEKIDTCLSFGGQFAFRMNIQTGNITWGDGNTSPTRHFSESGYYSFLISSQCDTVKDSIKVNILHFPRPDVLPNIDTCLVDGKILVYTPSSIYETITWKTSNQSSIRLSDNGTYEYIATTACGVIEDKINVILNIIPELEVLDTIERCVDNVHSENLDVWSNFPYTVYDVNGNILSGLIKESQNIIIQIDEFCGFKSYPSYIKLHGTPVTWTPNAFTPNGDQFNNTFEIKGENFEVKSISIFNRWGQVVYSETGGFNGWDGTHKGIDCVEGVYLVHLELETCGQDLETKVYKLNLIR
jgi:gliding motility-associated-like protein